MESRQRRVVPQIEVLVMRLINVWLRERPQFETRVRGGSVDVRLTPHVCELAPSSQL